MNWKEKVTCLQRKIPCHQAQQKEDLNTPGLPYRAENKII